MGQNEPAAMKDAVMGRNPKHAATKDSPTSQYKEEFALDMGRSIEHATTKDAPTM